MIRALYYFECDACGTHAQPSVSPDEARVVARAEGFDSSAERGDLCQMCARFEGQVVA